MLVDKRGPCPCSVKQTGGACPQTWKHTCTCMCEALQLRVRKPRHAGKAQRLRDDSHVSNWLKDHFTCQHTALCSFVLVMYWCFCMLHFGPNSSQSCARATWLGPARLHVVIDDQIRKVKHCQEHKLVNSVDRKLVTLFGPVFLGFSVRRVLLYPFTYQNLVFNLVLHFRADKTYQNNAGLLFVWWMATKFEIIADRICIFQVTLFVHCVI